MVSPPDEFASDIGSLLAPELRTAATQNQEKNIRQLGSAIRANGPFLIYFFTHLCKTSHAAVAVTRLSSLTATLTDDD